MLTKPQQSLFFAVLVLIWGSTWIAIKMQLGVVLPAWSITYRFLTAGLILLSIAALKKQTLAYPLRTHLMFLLQGLFLFSFNFVLMYNANHYLISGLGALIFSSILLGNVVNERIFFKRPIDRKTILGGLIGMLGTAWVLYGEVQSFDLAHQSWRNLLIGTAYTLGAMITSSLGTTLAAYQSQEKHPIFVSTGYSMLYGALSLALVNLFLGLSPQWDSSPHYIASLFYLTMIGSVLAFSLYLQLVSNIGQGRSAYVFVITPTVAVVISCFVEHLPWQTSTTLGLLLAVSGNLLILKNTAKK